VVVNWTGVFLHHAIMLRLPLRLRWRRADPCTHTTPQLNTLLAELSLVQQSIFAAQIHSRDSCIQLAQAQCGNEQAVHI
jgi:hypothetical protein